MRRQRNILSHIKRGVVVHSLPHVTPMVPLCLMRVPAPWTIASVPEHQLAASHMNALAQMVPAEVLGLWRGDEHYTSARHTAGQRTHNGESYYCKIPLIISLPSFVSLS